MYPLSFIIARAPTTSSDARPEGWLGPGALRGQPAGREAEQQPRVGGGEEAHGAGREANDRAAPSRSGEQRQFPFCLPASAARRLAPCVPAPVPAACYPSLRPFVRRRLRRPRRQRWQSSRGCRGWTREIKFKLNRAGLRRWAGEFLGAGARAAPRLGPLAAPGSDLQVRKREAPEPRGRGMHVPLVTAAGERTAGQSLRVLQTRQEGASENKTFAGAWAEAGVPGAGDAARTARSRRQPAGLCLPFPSTSQLRSAQLARSLLSPPLALAPPRARSPRPASLLPLSRD